MRNMRHQRGYTITDVATMFGFIVAMIALIYTTFGERLQGLIHQPIPESFELVPMKPQGPFKGENIQSVTLSWAGIATGIDVLAGTMKPKSILLVNTGSTPSLNLKDAFTILGDKDAFSIKSNDCEKILLPNASCSIEIHAVSSTNGTYYATLTVSRHNAPSIILSSTVSGFIPELIFDAGQKWWISPSNQKYIPIFVTLRNIGTTNASGMILQTDDPDFLIADNNCPPILAPGSSCFIRITTKIEKNGTFRSNIIAQLGEKIMAVAPLEVEASAFE